MLKEFTSVRQIPEDGFRRWFTDDEFDLFIWYADSTEREIVGFQLCYNKKGNQKALTWYREKGYLHTAVDDGEGSPLKNRTPILVADGIFPKDRVIDLFRRSAKNIDRQLFELVDRQLVNYPKKLG